MCGNRVRMVLVLAVVSLALGGCQGLVEPSEPSQIRTPAPVPTAGASTPTPATGTPAPNGRALGGSKPGQWSEGPPEPSPTEHDRTPTGSSESG